MTERLPLKEDDKKETHKLSSNKSGVVGFKNNQRDEKAPPEETGQENILDLIRWPLLLKYNLICTLLCKWLFDDDRIKNHSILPSMIMRLFFTKEVLKMQIESIHCSVALTVLYTCYWHA